MTSNYPDKDDDLYFTAATEEVLLDLDPDEEGYLDFTAATTEEIPYTPKASFPKKQITILTGKLDPRLIPENASEGLRKNLRIAREINEHVNKLVPFSYNFLQRSPIFSKGHYDDNHLDTLFKTMAVRQKASRASLMEEVEETIEHKTGNCEDLSDVGLVLGLSQGKNVTKAAIENGDHVLLIVGSGRDSVICDPWTKANYPITELKHYLFDYIGQVDINGIRYTQVKRFNPLKQKIVRQF